MHFICAVEITPKFLPPRLHESDYFSPPTQVLCCPSYRTYTEYPSLSFPLPLPLTYADVGSYRTVDCGSNQFKCNGAEAAPLATHTEFTLGTGGQDFYDVSLVDGYNLPMIVEGSGRSGLYIVTGCSTNLNQQCSAELKVGEGEACKSACEDFGSPEYCCSDAYNTLTSCKPSVYSDMFKAACPKSYSFAYDDATSTLTCAGADYTVTFTLRHPL